MNRPRRRHALKTRLALIALGVGLGLTARWISSWLSDNQQPTHFEPMPTRLDERPDIDPAPELEELVDVEAAETISTTEPADVSTPQSSD